jgi:hypothetical protein
MIIMENDNYLQIRYFASKIKNEEVNEEKDIIRDSRITNGAICVEMY